MERTRYSTDLTDKQWEVFAVFFIVFSSKVGRPPKYCLREIINAIFYLVHTGCQWRELPHDFPPWPSVYYHFRKYDLNWASIHRSLHADLREKSGRKPEPTAAIIDSQSVKTSSMADSKGIDGNKKIKGRKRHVVVDTLGFPLIVKVHDANLFDGKQAVGIIEEVLFWFANIKTIWADAAYKGVLSIFLICAYFCKLEIAPTLKGKGFQVVPKRWIVERTFGWFEWDRRLSIDYERQSLTSENMVYIASIGKMLGRYN